MFRDKGGRIRSLSRDEFARLLAELPPHLAEMARFSVATGLRQANVTHLQWRQISLKRRHLWVGARPAQKRQRPRCTAESGRHGCLGAGARKPQNLRFHV